ncbi:MAG: lipocalin family protein [Bacteroidota bacterium]
MKLNKLFIMVICALLLVAGCKKDEEASIIGTWKVTSAVFNPPAIVNGDTLSDAYPIFFPNSCNRDNVFIFESGGVFKNDEGATKCDPLDDQTSVGTYILSGSNLTWITDTDTTSISNAAITKTTLTGTFTEDNNGTTIYVDATMTRQ